MVKAIETLSIKLEFKDSAGTQQIVDKLSSSLRGMSSVVKGNTSPAISKLRQEILKVGEASTKSIANFDNQTRALKALRNEARVGSATFKKLGEDIKNLEQQKARATGGKRIGGRAATQIAGAVVSGGIFGGPEGAIGGALGGALGGVQGAFAGAAIGAQVGGLRQAAGQAAEYAAGIERLRIALKGVTTSQEEYFEGLRFVQQTTEDFAIPQEVVTRQFTKLQASVQGAGGDINDTKQAFNGIIAAVRATGGSLQDVDSALTATAQVFSKGKVSAEELRQQIGERLPGAFSLFAKSVGLTPQELDKALERGEVSLQDFQTFTAALFKRYGENAKIIASGPNAAGARLTVQLEKLNESVGNLLRPLGAFFQSTFAAIVRDITRATDALARFLNLSFDQGKLDAAQRSFDEAQAGLDAGAKGKKRQALIRKRESARQRIDAQISLRDASSGGDVQQSDPGTGLPGITPDAGGSDGKSKLERRIEAAQKLEARQRALLNISQAETKLGEFLAKQENARVKLAEQIEKINKGVANEEIKRAVASAKKLQLESQGLELQKKVRDLASAATQDFDKALQQVQAKVAGEKRYKELLDKGVKPENAKLIIQLEAKKKVALENLDILIDELKIIVAGKNATQDQIDLLDELLKKRKQVEGTKPEEQVPPPETKSGFEDFKETVKAGLEEMTELAPQLANVALSAVDGITDSIVNLIKTGKANFREFAAGILEDIGKILLRAAIAKIALSFFGPNANGSVMDAGRIKPYAKGGVVTSPTAFPMADGEIGLMGEAGPEAIMPLKRAPNGRLGVEVANQGSARDAMNRYSRRSTSGGGGGMSVEDEMIAGQSSGPVAIDVRYNVERINEVDYVTAEEFKAGMQRAAQQGASEGERRTLRSLKYSSATRRGVGF